MSDILSFFAIIFVVIGTIFSISGVIGFYRFPDVYTRLHATGKVGAFGAVLLLAAAIAVTPLTIGKGLVLILFLLITGPATSHALGSAAYRLGIPMKSAVRDDLAKKVQITKD